MIKERTSVKLVGAIFLIVVAFVIGFVSAIAGALMLTTGNPTPGNWIAFYCLTYLVPWILLAGTIFALYRMFRS